MRREYGVLKPRTITLPVLALVLTGCALSPVLESTQEFKPADTEGLPCSTRVYSTALKCAATLDAELSKITKNAHGYNLGSSYSAWTLGTVTGGVLAFGGGEGVLKGLAVGVGALVGLNTIVKPDEQLKIARVAQRELQCVVSVAEAIRSSQESSSLQGARASSQHAIAALKSARTPLFLARDKGAAPKVDVRQISDLLMVQAQEQKFISMANSAAGLAGSVGLEADVAAKLSDSVLTIRSRVTEQLAAISSTTTEASNDQRDLVVGMAGEIIRKRSDLKKQQQAVVGSGDTEVETLASLSLEATVGIKEAFAKCADQATLEALGG